MEKYKIKKGHHYSNGVHIKRYKGGDLVIFGKFNLNCWHFPDAIPDSGKNKLSGITFGFRGVHENSIRIAWQADIKNNQINLFAYYYNHGIRFVKPISSVTIGQEFMIRILFDEDSFKIRFGEFETKYLFDFPDTVINYYNYPYFGSDSVAPWDMEIFMKTQEAF